MVKAVNKFKTADFLAQQALKAAKTAARQAEQSGPTQPLGLRQTSQSISNKQASEQKASKSHTTHQTGHPVTDAAAAQAAVSKLHARQEPAIGRHATALPMERPAITRTKRGLSTAAAELAEASKPSQPQPKKPKLAKTVAVPTIFAAPAPQGRCMLWSTCVR